MSLRLMLTGLALSLAALSGCATLFPPANDSAPALQAAIAAPLRSEANTARDRYRHPQQTLAFFGVQPNMTVVEVWPGAGWYTEILAPYLREDGQYLAAGVVVDDEKPSAYRLRTHKAYAEKIAANPEAYGHVVVTALGKPDRYTAAPAASADRVLTFRNVHNWLASEMEAPMFKAFYTALKPGGVLGVVEHRAAPGTTLEQMKKSGYVTEALVIQLAEAAGFKLDARSEINANPLDTKDYAEGVWTLPPTYELGDKDREKYAAIGESDRMTLRFVKP